MEREGLRPPADPRPGRPARSPRRSGAAYLQRKQGRAQAREADGEQRGRRRRRGPRQPSPHVGRQPAARAPGPAADRPRRSGCCSTAPTSSRPTRATPSPRCVDELATAHPDVVVECHGPWPPYSFADAGAAVTSRAPARRRDASPAAPRAADRAGRPARPAARHRRGAGRRRRDLARRRRPGAGPPARPDHLGPGRDGGATGERGDARLSRSGWRPTPSRVERDLFKLVLTIIELVRQLMEKQALRRVDEGDLTDEQIEGLGLGLMHLEQAMEDLKARLRPHHRGPQHRPRPPGPAALRVTPTGHSTDRAGRHPHSGTRWRGRPARLVE